MATKLNGKVAKKQKTLPPQLNLRIPVVLNGETVAFIDPEPHVWNTGTDGYMGLGKVVINGAKYQAKFDLFRVGSKNE